MNPPRDWDEALALPEREPVGGLARVLGVLGGNLIWSIRARKALRARHNDHDYACVFWWGDRRMEPRDYTTVFNTEMGGDWTSLFDRRCTVCAPFDRDEATDLVDPSEPFEHMMVMRRTP